MRSSITSRIILGFMGLALVVILMLLVAYNVNLPLSPLTDFRVLYLADSGMLRGVHLYDVPGQEAITKSVLGAPTEQLPVIPFPYLPWLALGTLFLGFLPINAAMVLWLEINLLLLFISVWMLTDGWQKLPKLLAFPASLFFIPVLGTLAVGQYDFPILLGASMLIFGLRKNKTVISAIGFWLVIIKPHLGLLISIGVVIYLILKNTNFAKKTFIAVFSIGIILFILGFVADPAWVVRYPQSLLNYSGQKHITTCSECASFAMLIYRAFNHNPSLAQAAWISLPVLAISGIVFAIYHRTILSDIRLLIGIMVITTLLASPYIYNYDFVLLLIPVLSVLNPHQHFLSSNKPSNLFKHVIAWLPSVLLLTSTVIIAFWGRDGNVSFIVITLIIGILLFRRIIKPSDIR